MTDSTINEYFDALERLKNNTPINLPKGSKINNDTVALEAGRKRGSIKKSREQFLGLIEAIDEAKDQATAPLKQHGAQVEKYKKLYNDYREKYEAAINRELMLADKVAELEKEVRALKSRGVNNVF